MARKRVRPNEECQISVRRLAIGFEKAGHPEYTVDRIMEIYEDAGRAPSRSAAQSLKEQLAKLQAENAELQAQLANKSEGANPQAA